MGEYDEAAYIIGSAQKRAPKPSEYAIPVRQILTPKKGGKGLFIQPSEFTAEREVEEGHNRERFAGHFKFADMYTGNTRTYDENARYNCEACNQEHAGHCLLVNNGKDGVPLKIDGAAGSCGDWENKCAGDPEMALFHKSPDAAGYGVALNGIGFGCLRCPYASAAYRNDSRGRDLYCGKGDFRTFSTACCALNGAPVK